ncbi:MAG TPA: transglycosylase SLT domain-containing protein [Gemmatimonadaceae bacterium]|nr:transglycosylase SLT domain-containing protein [Gemmatimonadaceae bacterium]
MLVVVVTLILIHRRPETASAEVAGNAGSTSRFSFLGGSDSHDLRQQLETTKGNLDLLRAQYERADKIIHFSTRFAIPANVAGNVLDAALAEGIDPELAFRLVKLESDFNPHATSPVGAVGLTQLMLPTARFFDRGITRERLYDPKTNLRVGFRYLRTLITEYHNDPKLALLVYNRGEVAVKSALEQGIDPSNGYDRVLTKGYKGNGVIE